MTRPVRVVVAGAALLLAAAAGADAGGGVAPWRPARVSSPQWESHPAFDPVNGDFYFVRSTPAFESWRLFVSHCTASGWSEPERPAFATEADEADPWFAADGRWLYFISARPFEGKKGKDLDIWRVGRGADGAWGRPERLPEPVNSDRTEWFPRLSADGRLYFGSNREGGHGGNDIWSASPEPGGRWTVENLGPAINTASDEYEPLPSADGQALLIATADGFFRSRKFAAGWSPREKLGPEVNANGTEIGPLVSPGGRTLLFSRDTKGPDSGEFFVRREGATEAWPPECPARAPP
jgi:Tol biopolymer transport system component